MLNICFQKKEKEKQVMQQRPPLWTRLDQTLEREDDIEELFKNVQYTTKAKWESNSAEVQQLRRFTMSLNECKIAEKRNMHMVDHSQNVLFYAVGLEGWARDRWCHSGQCFNRSYCPVRVFNLSDSVPRHFCVWLANLLPLLSSDGLKRFCDDLAVANLKTICNYFRIWTERCTNMVWRKGSEIEQPITGDNGSALFDEKIFTVILDHSEVAFCYEMSCCQKMGGPKLDTLRLLSLRDVCDSCCVVLSIHADLWKLQDCSVYAYLFYSKSTERGLGRNKNQSCKWLGWTWTSAARSDSTMSVYDDTKRSHEPLK
jgi:hypothetical protein